MSTKSTVAHGPAFHLYSEVFDEDNVYLEIEGTHFEASYNRVMIPIPIHVWQIIRRCPGTQLNYAKKTDEELRFQAEQDVDDRLKRYQESLQQDSSRAKALAFLGGGFVYGDINQPREQQIETGIQHFIKRREHQQQILAAIAELERAGCYLLRDDIDDIDPKTD